MPAPVAPLAPAADPLLIDVIATAALVKVSTRTVTRWSDAGIMPKGRKLGNLVRWSKAEIQKWVDDGCPKMGAAS